MHILIFNSPIHARRGVISARLGLRELRDFPGRDWWLWLQNSDCLFWSTETVDQNRQSEFCSHSQQSLPSQSRIASLAGLQGPLCCRRTKAHQSAAIKPNTDMHFIYSIPRSIYNKGHKSLQFWIKLYFPKYFVLQLLLRMSLNEGRNI